MKRLVIMLGLLSMIFGIVAFDCSSSSLNGAKSYMDPKVHNYGKAREMLNQEIATNPKSDEAYFLLGKIDGIEKNYKAMMDDFDKCLAISNKFASDVEYQKATYLKSEAERGITLYNLAYKGDSTTANYTRALKAFDNAMMIAPDSSFVLENYVYTAINLGRNDLLEAPLQRWVKVSRKAYPATLLGRLYIEYGNKAKDNNDVDGANAYYGKAIDILNAARIKYNSDPAVLEILTNAYLYAKRVDEAKKAFLDGIKEQPDNKTYRYNYGTILLNIKEYTGAEEQLKKAIEIDGNYLDAIYNLAACYVNWGVDIHEKDAANTTYQEKIKLAIPLLLKYLEQKPEDANVWDTLGRAYAGTGSTKESENAYKKADQLRGK